MKMNTRNSRSIAGALLPEAAHNDEVLERFNLPDSDQLLEIYMQFAQSSADSFGAFVTEVEKSGPSSSGQKTFGLDDKDGPGISPNNIFLINNDEPEPEDGPVLTVSNPQKIEGDEGDNILEGSAADNKIYGYGGDDTIYGNGGSNSLFGGDGEDDIFGGDEADHIEGGADADNLYGEGGNDRLRGGDGDDTIFGGSGDDEIQGDEGDDTAFGGEGDDSFMDNGGNDTYTGGEGADNFIFYEINFWAGAGGGHDLILDFELGVDTLTIGQFPTEEYAGLTFNEYIDQYASGGGEAGVVIEWANGLIRLAGIDKEDLTPWDVDIIA